MCGHIVKPLCILTTGLWYIVCDFNYNCVQTLPSSEYAATSINDTCLLNMNLRPHTSDHLSYILTAWIWIYYLWLLLEVCTLFTQREYAATSTRLTHLREHPLTRLTRTTQLQLKGLSHHTQSKLQDTYQNTYITFLHQWAYKYTTPLISHS